MRLVYHLVTSTGDVSRGGLPETVNRVAAHLAVGAQARVVLYTLGQAAPGVDRLPYPGRGPFRGARMARCSTVGRSGNELPIDDSPAVL